MLMANQIENNLLYILLKCPEKQPYIFDNLDKRFFKSGINAIIFDRAKELYNSSGIIDMAIVNNSFKDLRITERLADIEIDCFAVSPMAEIYCKTLFNEYIKTLTVNAKTESDLKEIQDLKNQYQFESSKIKRISDDIGDFDKRYKEKQNSAIFTYYASLDSTIGSFMGGDYIALGGSTGTGKTSIALNLARMACMQDKTVLYFSLEMTLEQIQNRFVCMNENLSSNKFRTFGFNLTEMMKYKQGLENLKQWNLNIVADYNITSEKIKRYIQEQKRKQLDFVIIDYLGLIQGENNKGLYENTTLNSRKIKLLATEFNIPILVLVQLNRSFKDRQDKRPILSDIRESGAIEQDADHVLFAFRPSIYDSKVNKNCLEIIVAKNRHGESNKIVPLNFDLSTQLITD